MTAPKWRTHSVTIARIMVSQAPRPESDSCGEQLAGRRGHDLIARRDPSVTK